MASLHAKPEDFKKIEFRAAAEAVLEDVRDGMMEACVKHRAPTHFRVQFFGSLGYNGEVPGRSDVDVAVVSDNSEVLLARREILQFVIDRSKVLSNNAKKKAFYDCRKATMYVKHGGCKVDITVRASDDSSLLATSLLKAHINEHNVGALLQWACFVQDLFPSKEIAKTTALFVGLASGASDLEGILRFVAAFKTSRAAIVVDAAGARLEAKKGGSYVAILYGPERFSSGGRISPVVWVSLQVSCAKSLMIPAPNDLNPPLWDLNGENRFATGEFCHVATKTFRRGGVPVIFFTGADNSTQWPNRSLRELLNFYACVSLSTPWQCSAKGSFDILCSLCMQCNEKFGAPLLVGVSKGAWNIVEFLSCCVGIRQVPVRGVLLCSGYV